jgi:hypothetical protein
MKLASLIKSLNDIMKKILKKENKDGELKNSLTNQNSLHSSDKKTDATSTINWSSLYKKEDWWAVWIRLIIFILSIPSYFGIHVLGWIPIAKSWTDISHALIPFSIYS